MDKVNNKIGASFSGGGAHGAYYAGMMCKSQKEYDVVIGASTGSLIATMVACGNWKNLKIGYTETVSKDILKDNPFRENGRIKVLKAVWNLIRGKELGDLSNIDGLIRKLFTQEDYNKLKLDYATELIITVTNISYERECAEFVRLKDTKTYEEFILFLRASCSVPVITKPVIINGDEYVDGGLTENTPLKNLKRFDLEHIDCFICDYERPRSRKSDTKNVWHRALRYFKILRSSMASDDRNLGELSILGRESVKNLKKDISFFYLPYQLSNNPLRFDPVEMQEWFMMGENSAQRSM